MENINNVFFKQISVVYKDFSCFMHVGSKTCLEYLFLTIMCTLT